MPIDQELIRQLFWLFFYTFLICGCFRQIFFLFDKNLFDNTFALLPNSTWSCSIMAVHYIVKICLYYIFLKVDTTSLRSIPVYKKARSILCQVHQLSSFCFEFSLSSSTNEISFKTFFLPFVCQSVEDLSSPHLIRLLVFVLSRKRLNLLCDSADCALHAGHVWFFLCLKMSFLSDDSSMVFILHLRCFTFLGHHQKSDRTFLPPM